MTQLRFLNRILMRHNPNQPLETVHPRPASRFESQQASEQAPQAPEKTPGSSTATPQSSSQDPPETSSFNGSISSNNSSPSIPSNRSTRSNRSYKSNRSYNPGEDAAPAFVHPDPIEEPPLLENHKEEKQLDIHFKDRSESIPLEKSGGILVTPGNPPAQTPGTTKTSPAADSNVTPKVTSKEIPKEAPKVAANATQSDKTIAVPLHNNLPGETLESNSQKKFFTPPIDSPPGRTAALLEEDMPAGLDNAAHSPLLSPSPDLVTPNLVPSHRAASNNTSLSASQSRSKSQSPSESVVNVTIGKVEVRAAAPSPKKSSRRSKKPSGVISLDKYLHLRSQSRQNQGGDL